MSKSRVPSSERKSGRTPVEITGECHRFVGVSLSGGKSDKACVAVVEYFPKFKKIFLSKIFEKIKTEGEISADLKIQGIVNGYEKIEFVAFDVPWRPPLCFQCEKPCPGYESCSREHIQWMRDWNKAHQLKKKPKRMFSPYLERAIEMYVKTELEESLQMGPAMGANTAPLLARASYLQRRIKRPCVEVFPKLSVWRMGRSLGVSKTFLRSHRSSVGGTENRRTFLRELAKHNVAFMYEQDLRQMIENNHAFEAFICALTAYLKFSGQTEARPPNFPSEEDWIEFPQKQVVWIPGS